MSVIGGTLIPLNTVNFSSSSTAGVTSSSLATFLSIFGLTASVTVVKAASAHTSNAGLIVANTRCGSTVVFSHAMAVSA